MADVTQIEQIPIERTKISKFNVRKNVGDIAELVESVKSVGVLEPIVARPAGKEFEVIIGSRRLAAAKEAGLKTIPAIVKKLSDDDAILESLVENLQRGELSEEDMVGAFNTLHDFNPKRWTQGEFAKRVGKTQQWVSRLLGAYNTFVKLEEAGLVKGMKANPRDAEKEKGIAPVWRLTEIEEALNVTGLSEKEKDEKRVELAKSTLDLPESNFEHAIDHFKMYPERPTPQLREEALAATAGVALRTYLPPSVARQIEEKTGQSIEEGISKVIEMGLESIPAKGQERSPIKHWAEDLEQDSPAVQEGNRLKWNLERIDNMAQNLHVPPSFYTTSYSGRDVATFVELMKAGQVGIVYDIRDTPHSQFRPEFNREALSKALKEAGIEYKHVPELGVKREVRDELAKSGNYNAFWKKYDDGLKAKDKHEILEEIGKHFDEAQGEPFALFCMERDPHKCHRHRLALHLSEEWSVESIDI